MSISKNLHQCPTRSLKKKKNVLTLPYMTITLNESYTYIYLLFSTWNKAQA